MLATEELQRLKAGYAKMFCMICRRETWWRLVSPKPPLRGTRVEVYRCENCGCQRVFKTQFKG